MGTSIARSDYKRVPVRCDSTDPHACKHCGQFLAIPGTEYCPIHTNASDVASHRQALYDLKHTQVAAKIAFMKGHPEARNLTTELALLRVTLESLLNECESPHDFLMNEGAIGRLVGNINSTLVSNQKLEEKVGELLSVDQVITLIQMFFEVVKDFVSDPVQQEAIAMRINAIMANREYVRDQ